MSIALLTAPRKSIPLDQRARHRPPPSASIVWRLEQQYGPAFPPPSPALVTGAEGFGYMVGGVGLNMESKAQTEARSAVPTGQTAASAASLTSAEHAQGRSRKRPRSIVDPGYRYEFIEADEDAALASALPDRYRPSDSRASIQGFTGTLPKPVARVAGLITLTGKESGDRTCMPMVPESWEGS
ncbi:hypothetical protein [Mycobacterium sp. E2479]|uniref:PPW family C-terminal domain-containing PPE protein n=1 Tax=Mycobacterium sp. E2479 TaxID=1834134 RepID=UPI0007FF1FE4|nr:hypothetical protein [Mycobacterium sp. E2479]OBH53547.1 hypothetical protein A5686_08960 [Mycobacterium sp. E2479]